MQNIYLYNIFPFKFKQTFINNIWEFGCSSLQTTSCFLLGKVFLGLYGALSQGLGPPNHLSLEGIIRFSSSVEIKNRTCFPKQHILTPKFYSQNTLKIYMLVQLSSLFNEMFLCNQLIHTQKLKKKQNNNHNPDSVYFPSLCDLL